MKELIAMFQICDNEDSEVIKVALGKHEFTGRIMKDFLKVIENGKGISRN